MNEQPQSIQILQVDQDSNDEINIRGYLLFLKNKLLMISIVVILVMSLAILYIFIAKSKYEAKAVLKFQSSSGGGLASAIGSILPIGQANDMSTEIEIMKSRQISESVINELKLNEKPEYQNLSQNQILKVFLENLKIKKKGDTNLVDIVAINHSPQLAKEIANTVAKQYIIVYIESFNNNWNRLIEQMNSKLNDAKKELDMSRQMLYKNESKEGINTAFGPLLLGGGIAQSGTQYLESDISQAVAILKNNIMQMEITLESLRKKLPEANPQIISIKNQIAETKQKLNQEESKLLDKYNKQFGLSELAAKVVFNQQMYAMLVTKQEELKAQYMMQNKTPEIIEDAIEPVFPFSPRKVMILAMGLLMGIIFAIGLAIFTELIFNKINIYDDLNKYEGIPILGKIPKIKSKNNDYKGLLIYNDTGQNWVNEYYKESYKLLRTEIISSLNNDKNDGRGKVIMITSPIPKEGKSILSANIAISLSEAGYSVLMVDLNQNYPSQESIFDANSIIGLSDLLIEKGSGNDVANSTNIDGLSLITPGSKKYDLSGLLTSEKLTRLIDELRSKYDYILFDSNSIMLSSDSLAVGQKIDGIILILRAGFSKKDAVTKVIQKIKDNNIDLLGIILNCASPNRKYRKYYKS